MHGRIRVIDVFAGPGGLSEGFTRYREAGKRIFSLELSIEKDQWAHRTLELRSFYRQLRTRAARKDYFRYLRGEDEGGIDRATLFARYRAAARRATAEALQMELGSRSRAESSRAMRRALGGGSQRPWVLIGGPPCQAYSTAGRSRMRPVWGAREFEKDSRQTLYREYLHILERHRPHAFIMENVKGILSSQLKSRSVFGQILDDLHELSYALFSLTRRSREQGLLLQDESLRLDPVEFVIKAENHGVPQARHRVIIFGIRSDLLRDHGGYAPPVLRQQEPIPVTAVLADLPRLRSGLSYGADSDEAWIDEIRSIPFAQWLGKVNGELSSALIQKITRTAEDLRMPQKKRGSRYVRFAENRPRIRHRASWYEAPGLGGACNHETRGHMPSDLHRYLFASCFAQVYGDTPKLRDFPKARFPAGLLPAHVNARQALRYGNFNDRFRVQLAGQPATTIMAHIAKDGHYYIHPDPSQCRSLTVREAARIQTFPDDYFFEGPRTEQYRQVGNAVPREERNNHLRKRRIAV